MFINRQPSATATQALYNVGILIEEERLDKETGGITIIVKKRGSGYLWGGIITGFFGLCTLGCIWGSISTSDWWFEWQKKHNF